MSTTKEERAAWLAVLRHDDPIESAGVVRQALPRLVAHVEELEGRLTEASNAWTEHLSGCSMAEADDLRARVKELETKLEFPAEHWGSIVDQSYKERNEANAEAYELRARLGRAVDALKALDDGVPYAGAFARNVLTAERARGGK